MIGLHIDPADLAKAEDAIIRRTLGRVTEIVREETRGLETDLEGLTRMAVPGRLWRAWRSAVNPRRGMARQPAGQVFVNGGNRSLGAMTFHSEKGRIVSKDGQYLAIPLPAAGSRGRGRTLTPGEWERRTGQRLRFVYRPGRASLLVADGGTLNARTGTFRAGTAKRQASGRGLATVPIFALVPFVDFKPGFSVEPVVNRREQRFLSRLRAEV